MNKIILIALFGLTGCVSTPPPKPIDPECNQLANYARGIAVLKQAGIPLKDVNNFTSTPVVATFPIQLVKEEVYARNFANPAEAYVTYYELCTTAGYQNMFKFLKSMPKPAAALVESAPPLKLKR